MSKMLRRIIVPCRFGLAYAISPIPKKSDGTTTGRRSIDLGKIRPVYRFYPTSERLPLLIRKIRIFEMTQLPWEWMEQSRFYAVRASQWWTKAYGCRPRWLVPAETDLGPQEVLVGRGRTSMTEVRQSLGCTTPGGYTQIQVPPKMKVTGVRGLLMTDNGGRVVYLIDSDDSAALNPIYDKLWIL